MPQHLGEVLALVQQAIALAQLSDDLLRLFRCRLIVMSSIPACWALDSHERWTTIRGPAKRVSAAKDATTMCCWHWRSGRATELTGRAYEQCP